MVAEAKTEYTGEYPERQEILKVLREIARDEYIEKDALEDILSGEFYRKMLGENASFFRKLFTFASLTTGTRKWSNKIIPVGYNPFPMLKSASLLFMTVPPALGTLSLLLGQNYVEFFLNILCVSLMKLAQTLPKLFVYKRLGLNFYLRIPVRITIGEQGYHSFRFVKLIKTTTPAVKLKDKLTKKLIKVNSEKDDLIVYAIVDAGEREDKKDMKVIPLKDCLPISYAAILSNNIQEVWIERIPMEKMKRTLTSSYEKYIKEWLEDYARACQQPMIFGNNIYERCNYPIGLAYRVIQKHNFWNRRKIYQELITIALYYVLLQNMSYQDALKSYCRLIDAISNFQKETKNKCNSSEEYKISMSILSKKNRKELESLLESELGNKEVAKDLLNVMRAVKSLVDDYQKLKNERKLGGLEQYRSLGNLLKCYCFGENIPYIDRDVMRLGNRLFYGMNITDREWLDELTLFQTETEVYHKLRRLIPKDRYRTLKFNEVIGYLAHKYCVNKPKCQYCYLAGFCNFAKGRSLPTFNELLESRKNQTVNL